MNESLGMGSIEKRGILEDWRNDWQDKRDEYIKGKLGERRGS